MDKHYESRTHGKWLHGERTKLLISVWSGEVPLWALWLNQILQDKKFASQHMGNGHSYSQEHMHMEANGRSRAHLDF